MCDTTVAIASWVPTLLLNPSEYMFTGRAFHRRRCRTIFSHTLDNTGINDISLKLTSFFGIGTNLTVFHLFGSLPVRSDKLHSFKYSSLNIVGA